MPIRMVAPHHPIFAHSARNCTHEITTLCCLAISRPRHAARPPVSIPASRVPNPAPRSKKIDFVSTKSLLRAIHAASLPADARPSGPRLFNSLRGDPPGFALNNSLAWRVADRRREHSIRRGHPRHARASRPGHRHPAWPKLFSEPPRVPGAINHRANHHKPLASPRLRPIDNPAPKQPPRTYQICGPHSTKNQATEH